jgi:hypothetical protein
MRPVSRNEWIGIVALCAAMTLPTVILTPLLSLWVALPISRMLYRHEDTRLDTSCVRPRPDRARCDLKRSIAGE